MIWDYNILLNSLENIGSFYEAFINGLAIKNHTCIINHKPNRSCPEHKIMLSYMPYENIKITMANYQIEIGNRNLDCNYIITLDTRSALSTELHSEVTYNTTKEIEYEC